MKLIDEEDLEWIADVVDIVERASGQPWRVALERLDDTRRVVQPSAPRRFGAVVGALQRVVGGPARNRRLAQAARALALGRPTLTAAEREARIAAAADTLAVPNAAIERLLWADLPRERPIELPMGRPSELEIAALANIQILQRAICRAHAITLRVWGDAGPVIRAAATRGLLSTVSSYDAATLQAADAATASNDNATSSNDDATVSNHNATTVAGWSNDCASTVTVLDIIGPLALCHRTSVYGRALAGLVPLLAGCARFELDLYASTATHPYHVHCASPVLLPGVPARMSATSPAIGRLAREIDRARPELRVATAPRPIASGATLVCPDMAISGSGHTRYVELVGFWTTEFLERKLARYRDAGLDVRLCIDDARGCADDDPPRNRHVVRYTRQLAADQVLDDFP